MALYTTKKKPGQPTLPYSLGLLTPGAISCSLPQTLTGVALYTTKKKERKKVTLPCVLTPGAVSCILPQTLSGVAL